jgi:hypothetical protein
VASGPDGTVEVVTAADRSGGTLRTVLLTLLVAAVLAAGAAAGWQGRARRAGV